MTDYPEVEAELAALASPGRCPFCDDVLPDNGGRPRRICEKEDCHREYDALYSRARRAREEQLASAPETSPAAVARARFDALERQVLPWLDNDWRGQDVLRALRKHGEALVRRLATADWKPPPPLPSPVPGISAEDFEQIRAEEEAMGRAK